MPPCPRPVAAGLGLAAQAWHLRGDLVSGEAMTAVMATVASIDVRAIAIAMTYVIVIIAVIAIIYVIDMIAMIALIAVVARHLRGDLVLGPPKRGVCLNFPYMRLCLLVWDRVCGCVNQRTLREIDLKK